MKMKYQLQEHEGPKRAVIYGPGLDIRQAETALRRRRLLASGADRGLPAQGRRARAPTWSKYSSTVGNRPEPLIDHSFKPCCSC